MSKDLKLTTPVEELEENILSSEDPEELTDIIELFNLNLQKRNIIRNKKLNDIQDEVVDKMLQKIQEEPWDFSNDDLIKYHKVIQDSLAKANTLDETKIPSIQLNQQINISSPEFNRDSRSRILSAVQQVLNSIDTNEIEEVEEIDGQE